MKTVKIQMSEKFFEKLLENCIMEILADIVADTGDIGTVLQVAVAKVATSDEVAYREVFQIKGEDALIVTAEA